MKKIFPFIIIAFTFIYTTGCSNTKAAAGASSDSVWTFRADQIRPNDGNSRMLNGYNAITWEPNKLSVQLPYTGRAYSGADIISGKSPLDFISKNFTVARNRSGNKEEITITPNDVREVRNMMFTVYDNGTASLSIIMSNRSGVSYSGTVGGRGKPF